MFFNNFFSLFFQQGKSVADTLGPVLISSGAFVLALISLQQFTQVKKTRNTAFLDKKFMFFQLYTCFFLGSASVYGICDWNWAQNGHWHCIDLALIFINVCLFATNYYTLQVKLSNGAAAKKAGMSEIEYYNQVIAPSLALQTN